LLSFIFLHSLHIKNTKKKHQERLNIKLFDTIKCKCITDIKLERFQALQKQQDQGNQSNTYKTIYITENLNRTLGELTFTATIIGHKLHFIKYYSNTRTLIFEVSIPKYLKGNNIQMLKENDIQTFYKTLQNDLKELLDININIKEVVCIGLHVCYNVNIKETHISMEEWLNFISQLQIPYKPLSSLHKDKGKVTGISFQANKNSRSRLTFYDKQVESKDKSAGGILRIEVKTSKYERNKYGSTLMIDLLRPLFFQFIMDKYQINEILQGKLEESKPVGAIDYHYLIQEHEYKIQKIERILGFLKINDDMQQNTQSLYERKTLQNRQKELQAFQQHIIQKKE